MIRHNDNVIPFPDEVADAMRRHPAGKGRVNDVFLSRAIECPLCHQPVPDGDHEALFTRDAAGHEVWLMTGHRSCITAEVDRRNAVSSQETCDCGDSTCTCDCIPGNYPCEHGTMGEGCGA